MKSVKSFDLEGKRVLLRCDFNVPLSEQGKITDDFRIRQTLPTIKYLMEKKAIIILLSHLGRPLEEGSEIDKYSLKPVALRLAELLGREVELMPDCIGEEVRARIDKMQPGSIALLENLRFHRQEKENDPDFAQQLASLGDVYINDAFGVCHREHASVSAITKYLPSGAGLLLEKELKVLNGLLENPLKPLVAIIGGKKMEEKIFLIDSIARMADWVLIGGLLEREIKEKKTMFSLPEKIVIAVDDIEGFDIGPKTIELFREKLGSAKTIFWSGPMGKIEEPRFQKGSEEIMSAIIESGAFSVAGGGTTVEFINRKGKSSEFNHLSTGGEAMLDLLSGEKLPGIEALQ